MIGNTSSNVYQEEYDSTFEQEGQLYSLNKIFELTHKRKHQSFKVEDLSWILEYTSLDNDRVDQADVSIPVIVFFDSKYKKWVVADGAHRLTKAVKLKMVKIPAVVITEKELQSCKVNTKSLPKSIISEWK